MLEITEEFADVVYRRYIAKYGNINYDVMAKDFDGTGIVCDISEWEKNMFIKKIAKNGPNNLKEINNESLLTEIMNNIQTLNIDSNISELRIVNFDNINDGRMFSLTINVEGSFYMKSIEENYKHLVLEFLKKNYDAKINIDGQSIFGTAFRVSPENKAKMKSISIGIKVLKFDNEIISSIVEKSATSSGIYHDRRFCDFAEFYDNADVYRKIISNRARGVVVAISDSGVIDRA